MHDLAPGAKLSFANFDTDLAFNQAVNFLAASNDVVIDDIGFYGEPSDGTSAVSTNTAAALNNTGFPIRAYFTAVGNDADEHYYGAYTDSGVDGTSISGITTPGHLHLFQRTADTTDVLGLGAQPYNLIRLPQNGEVAIFLTWNDPFGASGNNYDLYLVQQSTGQVVAKSTDVQAGRQDPVGVHRLRQQGRRRFLPHRRAERARRGAGEKPESVFVPAGVRGWRTGTARRGPARAAQLQHRDAERHRAERRRWIAGGRDIGRRDLLGVRAAAGQFTAGTPNESCLDTSNRTIEFFSSQGPTLDGRVKPDVSAIDGVSVSGAGGFRRAVLRHLRGSAAPRRCRGASAAGRAVSAGSNDVDG